MSFLTFGVHYTRAGKAVNALVEVTFSEVTVTSVQNIMMDQTFVSFFDDGFQLKQKANAIETSP